MGAPPVRCRYDPKVPEFRFNAAITRRVEMTPQELEAQRTNAAKSQSLFREVNERIEQVSPPASFVEFVCECASEECFEKISVTLQEYDEIRANPNRFFVLPGHEIPQVEQTVEVTHRYLVVSKLGAGKRIAEKLDPRQRRRRA
jgi:hypothetical protein